MEEIMIEDGMVASFTVHGWPEGKKLVVRRGTSGGLVFEDWGAVATIAMAKPMQKLRAKLSPVMPAEPTPPTDIHIMPGTAMAKLYTPESEGQTCVYLDVWDDGLRLVGGLSIIEAIHGKDLETKIERG